MLAEKPETLFAEANASDAISVEIGGNADAGIHRLEQTLR